MPPVPHSAVSSHEWGTSRGSANRVLYRTSGEAASFYTTALTPEPWIKNAAGLRVRNCPSAFSVEAPIARWKVGYRVRCGMALARIDVAEDLT